VTLRFCIYCSRHYKPPGIRGRCADCGRAYDRLLSKQKRARRTRNSAAWQKARAAARQRDGNRCRKCGSIQDLEVHHIQPLANGGEQFALTNLITLCRDCHMREGAGPTRAEAPSHPRPVSRERNSGDPADQAELLVG
jgi:5-methylcytosine-specific restriction protein A